MNNVGNFLKGWLSKSDQSNEDSNIASQSQNKIDSQNRNWTLNNWEFQLPTIDQATWSSLERSSWLPYLDTVDDYLRKVSLILTY